MCLVSKQIDAEFLARLIPVFRSNLRVDLTKCQLTNYYEWNRDRWVFSENKAPDVRCRLPDGSYRQLEALVHKDNPERLSS